MQIGLDLNELPQDDDCSYQTQVDHVRVTLAVEEDRNDHPCSDPITHLALRDPSGESSYQPPKGEAPQPSPSFQPPQASAHHLNTSSVRTGLSLMSFEECPTQPQIHPNHHQVPSVAQLHLIQPLPVPVPQLPSSIICNHPTSLPHTLPAPCRPNPTHLLSNLNLLSLLDTPHMAIHSLPNKPTDPGLSLLTHPTYQ